MFSASAGPVSVAVNGNLWQFYGGGIFNNTNCDDTLNHAVLAVGYTKDLFIFKNSWELAGVNKVTSELPVVITYAVLTS
ncbi:unnamed protein product [Diabrotica balteata]|uniref:Peptidase C1A papain C-terminal domain-containing protein n=1 Tax=Diabrotica balteata TaxID=107213 RepID=A0A9N9T1Y4_DIABA|nr:unnamed protein product [Diabrotica balteata]